MEKYIEETLRENEVIVYRARISLWSQLPLILLGLALLPFGIGIIPLAITVRRYLTSEVCLTNHRVIAKWGLFARSTIELNARKIDSITIEQTSAGRRFNFGSLIIAGLGSRQTPIPNIARPNRFKRRFDKTFGKTTPTGSALEDSRTQRKRRRKTPQKNF